MLKVAAAPAVLGFALLSTSAFAQEAQSADDSAGDAIIVTGSRIPQPNLESATPITVVGAEDIKQTGTTRIEDMLNSLPQVFAGQNSNYSNGSSGTSTVNLRGLGSERNLVLVNGRRLVPGDPGSAAADLNFIPAALVQRVDVLTGGASSVYGADAVTGVVNFVMDTQFEGFKLDAQYGLYNHNNRAGSDVTGALDARGFSYPQGMTTDGGTLDATLAFGTSFDDGRGHITAYVGYRKINPILQSKRDYSSCALTARTSNTYTGDNGLYTCGGSGTSPTGTFYTWDSSSYHVEGGNTFLPGATPYNYAPTNYYQRPDERYTAGFFADYEISPALKPYAEFMFMDDRTVAQIAASGDFGNTLTINCDNPLLSAQQLAIVCASNNLLATSSPLTIVGDPINPSDPDSPLYTTPFAFTDALGNQYYKGFLQTYRRNVEGGGRQDDLQHTSYRAVLGMKGELGSAWSYDTYYQYGRTLLAETYKNDFSVTRLTRALDVVTDPSSGEAVCRSVLDGTDPNCVPWNIFTPGGVSAEALNYLQTPGFQRGINTEMVVSGSLAGDLGVYGIQSPWANTGIGLAVGAEYRKETLSFSVDQAFATGDLAGQGGATLPVAGDFDVKEVFGEINIPIVEDSFIDSLVLKAGYRYSDYKNSAGTSFSTDTYKVEFELAPIRDIRFRGGYNRAVRAPSIQDWFSAQRVVLDGTSDPCAKYTIDPEDGSRIGIALTPDDVGCLMQGLSVGQVVVSNPADQYNGLIGGNPNLQPEVADTYTLGVVLQPRFIPGLAVSVDWWKIKLDKAIQGIGADTIIANCVDNADAYFCGLIHRDGTGSIWRTSDGYVVDLTQNIGGLKTEGVDVNASYSYDFGFGRVSASFVGTYLDSLFSDSGAGSTLECAGLYGNQCGTPNPTWRHSARLGWTATGGAIGASIRWRYLSSVTRDTIPSTNYPVADLKIPSQSYFDLTFTARIEDHYTFRLGANNILDKSPPLTGSATCPAGPCNGNTWGGVYDALGRYIYAGFTLDF